MPRSIRSFDRINIPAPCDADWDSMIGNEQVRFCEHCSLHVTDLSSMTRADALRFVERSRSRVCIRYIVRPDGGMVTRKMPQKLYRIGRRASRIAAGAFSATLTLASAAGQTRPANSTAQSPTIAECVTMPATTEPGFDEVFPGVSGTIKTPEGAPIADAIVVLVDRDSGEERYTTSANNGEFVFQYVPSAEYLLWARKRGFETERETATVQSNEGVRKEITLTEKTHDHFILSGAMAVMEYQAEDPLVKAVADDDLAAVEKLAFATEDINAIKPHSGTPLLSQVVERGNREMARLLLRAGADVNLRSGFGQTAIMSVTDKTSAEIVRDLIDAGAKVNARDDNGDSALMIAAGGGSPALVKELLKAGAQIDATNSSGETALFAALRNNTLEVVELLISAGIEVNAKDEDGQTALMASLYHLNVETFRGLIEKGAELNLTDYQKRTALMSAAINEDLRILEALLHMGVNVDAKDSGGVTALMVAAETGLVKNARLLIYAGASLETKDAEGRTALLRAAFNGSPEMVEALLAAGADYTARDKEGKTALGLAREAEKDDVVSFLKDRGAPE